MKKIITLTAAFAGVMITAHARDGFVTGKTFFSSIPHFQKGSPERQSFFHNDLLEAACNNCFGGAFQVVLYGSRTTRGEGSEKLVKYFLPPTCHGCCLNVQEYNESFEQNSANAARSGDYNPIKDLEARNFNIVTNGGVNNVDTGSFASKLCFYAEQNVFGAGFNYKQRLSTKCNGTTGFWLEASLPVERIKNRFNFSEVIENTGDGADYAELGLDNSVHVDSMRAAFSQNNWNYGKIDCNFQNATWDVADIEVFVGYNYHTSQFASLNSYFGFIAPTGTRVRNQFLFEPIVGNNRHWGLMFGNEIYFNVYNGCDWDIKWLFDVNSRYLLENDQVRSFDLIGKSWSRYQETYNSPEQAALAVKNNDFSSGTSGINEFTACVKVKPHFQFRSNLAMNFNKYCDCFTWLAEIGWNFFARQKESVRLDCCEGIEGAALKGIDGNGTTTTARNIKANFRQSVLTFDERYLGLSNCDIDFESAAHPAVLAYSMYGTVGIQFEKDCPWFAGVGASFDFQQREINTAPERWTVWGKVGFTF